MVHVITKIERPPKSLMDQFREIGTATVHEASGKKGAVDYAIKPIAKGVRICGPAFTVQCHPLDNLMLHKALERAQPGDILVTTVGGHYEGGYLGGLMATSAMARKIGGLAIDGCIRDSAELIEMGFPCFCRGFSIKGTSKGVLGSINYPVVFGGVIVNPGDLILGDDDGMVVVARGEIQDVLEKSRQRDDKEAKRTVELRAGASGLKLSGFDKVFESLGLVED